MTPFDLRRAALEALAAEKNARRWAKGERVSDNFDARMRAATGRLGLPLPPAVAAKTPGHAQAPVSRPAAAPGDPQAAQARHEPRSAEEPGRS